MQDRDEKTRLLEERMALAEGILAETGAVPLNINRNREKLQQRRTWQYGGGFYRISHLEMNGEAFVTISTCDTAEYAAIGLMEEIEAIPLDTSAERMRQMIRCALDAEPGGQ